MKGEKLRDVSGPVWGVGRGVRKGRRNLKGKCGWRGGGRGNNDPTQRLLGKNEDEMKKMIGLSASLGGGRRKLRRNLKESVVGEVVREETTTHSQRLLGKIKMVKK